MKENRHWLRTYLRLNLIWICLGPIMVIITLWLAYLYQIDGEIAFYFSSFLLVADVIVTLISIKIFYQRERELEEQIREQEVDPEEKKWQEVREKEDFFALWTHQIKTPIAALSLLLQKEEIDRSASRNELFKIESYVEMALGYLRFEGMSSDLRLESYSLEEMTKQMVRKHAPIFIGKHLAVKLEHLDYQILTDEKWFCFVMEQILSNALKYTKEGSVRIYAKDISEENHPFVEQRTEHDHSLDIYIEDTGIGVRKEDIPRVFDKGFTGYNGRMDKKASGLGLYLAKGICEKLGHDISLTSEEGVGTCVKIRVMQETVHRNDLVVD